MAEPEAKLEFSVKLTCQSCVDAVKNALAGKSGVKLTGIDLDTQQVLVETTLPSDEVHKMIESTGREAVLMGAGSSQTGENLGAAVSEMWGSGAQGVIRLVQTDNDTCVIEGTVDGLKPGAHRLAIHEYGDLSEGCKSCGDILNGFNDLALNQEKLGDLGSIQASPNGRAQFRMISSRIKVWDLVGRSMVAHASEGPTSPGIVCGIIARSAGIMENAKRICACDGITLWDERNVPAVGPERRNFSQAAQL